MFSLTHRIKRDRAGRQVQAEVKNANKEAPDFTQTEKGKNQIQNCGKCEGTRAGRNGPSQRSFIPNGLRLAGDRPKRHRRGTRRSSRRDSVWNPTRTGGLARARSPCTGSRLPVHQKGHAREVSESPAESAVEVAEPSKRSATQRGSPSLPVCRPQLAVHRLQDATFSSDDFVDRLG